MKRWYVVKLRYKQEQVAEDNLNNQGFENYIPCMLEVRTRKGENINVLVPLFPGYMFVRFDTERDRWRAICSTKGVAQLLTCRDDVVFPLPKGFVEDLMAKENKLGYLQLPSAEETLREFVIGDELQIDNGVFAGFSGICERVKKDRVSLLLSLLSGKTIVEFPKQILSHVNNKDTGKR